MSKIIKKPKTGPIPVKLRAHAPVTGKSSKKPVLRSVDFTGTIDSEISGMQDSFDDYFARQKKSREEELAEVARNSREEGYQAGFADAVEKERSERVSAIDALLKEAKNKSNHAIRGLEIKVIDLAVRLAEEITRKSVKQYPDIVESIIEETMSYLVGNETVILRVSEEDYKLVNSKYDKWLNLAGSTQEFRVEVDRRLKPGDCMIETEGGMIDSNVDHRLETIAEELLKVMS